MHYHLLNVWLVTTIHFETWTALSNAKMSTKAQQSPLIQRSLIQIQTPYYHSTFSSTHSSLHIIQDHKIKFHAVFCR